MPTNCRYGPYSAPHILYSTPNISCLGLILDKIKQFFFFGKTYFVLRFGLAFVWHALIINGTDKICTECLY